jgi:hypothetical protein
LAWKWQQHFVKEKMMAAKANSQQSAIIQKEWENREFVEVRYFLRFAIMLNNERT